MNELKIFSNDEFGEVRTAVVNDEPMFCLTDICRVLEIGNPSQLKTRLKQDGITTNEVGVKTGIKADGTPAMQTVRMIFINESNLYKTIFQSRKESAERFTEWVTSEVLPSIRKHGMYATQELIDNPDLLISIATELKEERERNKSLADRNRFLESETVAMDKRIAELQPKADYVDIILNSKGTVTTTQIAQDYGMSARKFNHILSCQDIQRKVNGQWILYAKYQGQGYVQSKSVNIIRSSGEQDVVMNTEWTQKGRMFLYTTLKAIGILPTIEQ